MLLFVKQRETLKQFQTQKESEEPHSSKIEGDHHI